MQQRSGRIICLMFSVCLLTIFFRGLVVYADRYELGNISWQSYHGYFWTLDENRTDPDLGLEAIRTNSHTGQFGGLITSQTSIPGTESYRYAFTMEISSIGDTNVDNYGWGIARAYLGLAENIGVFGYNNIDEGNTTAEKLPDCIGVEIVNTYNEGTPTIKVMVFEDGKATNVTSADLTETQRQEGHLFHVVMDYNAVLQQITVYVDGNLQTTIHNVSETLAGGYFGFETQLTKIKVTKTEYSYPTVVVNPSQNGSLTIHNLYAEPGETVTVTAVPDDGYNLSDITVSFGNTSYTIGSGIIAGADNTYTFTMPAGGMATVSARYEKPYILNNINWKEYHSYFWELLESEPDPETGMLSLKSIQINNPAGAFGGLITSQTKMDGKKSYKYELIMQCRGIDDPHVIKNGWGVARVYLGLSENIGIFGYNNIDEGNTTAEKLPDCIGIEIVNPFDDGVPVIRAMIFRNGEAVNTISADLTEAQKQAGHEFYIVMIYHAQKHTTDIYIDGKLLGTIDNVDQELASGYFGFEARLAEMSVTKTAYNYETDPIVPPPTSDENQISVMAVVMLLSGLIVSIRKRGKYHETI